MVNGKAGSGKLTLIKYLSENQKTTSAHHAWSGESPLVMRKIFFSYNGKDLQKTQVGLLRSLIYQSLTNHRELIPLVLFEATAVASANLSSFWTLSRLKTALKKLLEQNQVPLKICLLVDGLDEYAGDHSEISGLFRYVAGFGHVKLCVSSRPLLEFERTFQHFPDSYYRI